MERTVSIREVVALLMGPPWFYRYDKLIQQKPRTLFTLWWLATRDQPRRDSK
jgi:hypothetical protein